MALLMGKAEGQKEQWDSKLSGWPQTACFAKRDKNSPVWARRRGQRASSGPETLARPGYGEAACIARSFAERSALSSGVGALCQSPGGKPRHGSTCAKPPATPI